MDRRNTIAALMGVAALATTASGPVLASYAFVAKSKVAAPGASPPPAAPVGPTATTPTAPASGGDLIVSNQNVRAVMGQPTLIKATFTGGRAPFVWTVTDGVLPRGMSLQGFDGTLFGTPQDVGSSLLVLTVTDASGRSVSAYVTVIVTPT